MINYDSLGSNEANRCVNINSIELDHTVVHNLSDEMEVAMKSKLWRHEGGDFFAMKSFVQAVAVRIHWIICWSI